MSQVADAKKNWLDQVKIDSENITRERLARELPKLTQVAEQMNTQSQPKPKKEGK